MTSSSQFSALQVEQHGLGHRVVEVLGLCATPDGHFDSKFELSIPGSGGVDRALNLLAQGALIGNTEKLHDANLWQSILSLKVKFNDGYGNMALPYAIVASRSQQPYYTDALRHMLAEGNLDPDLRDPDTGRTLLMLAAICNRGQMAAALIEAGADVSLLQNDPSDPIDALTMARRLNSHNVAHVIEAHLAHAAVSQAMAQARGVNP